jgi:hypothetical protein
LPKNFKAFKTSEKGPKNTRKSVLDHLHMLFMASNLEEDGFENGGSVSSLVRLRASVWEEGLENGARVEFKHQKRDLSIHQKICPKSYLHAV